MRLLALAATLLIGGASAAFGQANSGSSLGGDMALTGQYIHSNTQPGQCGCFNLTGAGISYSRLVTPAITGAAEISADFAKNGPGTGNSLTLVSYLVGVRHYVDQPFLQGDHHPVLFAQALVGIAHAGGGIAGAGDNTYALAAKLGGAIDVPVTYGISLRLIQADYYLTNFANAANGHQNNVQFSAGAVIRWSHVQ